MAAPRPAPADESRRLARLRELVVLDSEPELLFDSIARQASEVCGAPIALLSLIDEERQWFKANVGLPGVNETPRDIAFCAHAILDDALLCVADATCDARFSGNPLVTGAPRIRFYAGAPLALPGGERVGTLCVIDRTPRELTPVQSAMLRSLAEMATQALVMRRDLINRTLAVRVGYEEALAASEARHRALIEGQSELVSLALADGTLVYVNPAYARQYRRQPEDMIGRNLFDDVEPGDREEVARLIAGVFETGERRTSENRMLGPDGQVRWVAWTNSLQRDSHGQVMLHSVGRDLSERKKVEEALRASQGFLYRTGHVAGVGGWEVDVATGAVTWSDETRRIHEVPDDFLPTMETAIAFYPPESRAAIEQAVAFALREGRGWDLELPFVTALGRPIWVRSVGEVEFDQGQPTRLVGAFQDVTERKRLAQRLTESERFVRQITDSLPLRIAYIDAQRRFQFVNEAQCEGFGLPREKIIGRTRSQLRESHGDDLMGPRIDAALAGERQHFEFDGVVHGETRRIESRFIPDFGEAGEVRGFYVIGIDITERKAGERAVNELIAIFDNTPDFVVQSNSRGEVIYMNRAVRRAVGMTPQTSLAGRKFTEFNTATTNRRFTEVILPAVRAQGSWIGETTVLVAGQRELPVNHMVIAHTDAQGHIDRYSAVLRDISVEVEAKKQLLRQTATLRSVTEAIPAIVAVVGADGRYRFANGGFERWCGTSRDKVIGRSLSDVLGRVEYERSRPWVERAQAGETVSFEKNYPGRTSYAHLAISYIPLWQEDGRVDGFVQVAQDITHHRHEEGRLLQLSQRDALTGLLNRAGFEQYMARQIDAGSGGALALLCIDLDHFKPVNDQHGHAAGDEVLQMFAQRLRLLVRPTDAVARLGGDEFAVVLAGVREGFNARVVADKIIDAARMPFEAGPLTLRIGASVGVAFGTEAEPGWQALMARADAMLYRAKEAGRGQHAGTFG